MEPKKLEQIVEALLFTYGTAVEKQKLADVAEVTVEDIDRIFTMLKKKYAGPTSGITIIEIENSLQLTTKPDMYDYLKKAEVTPKPQTLSDAALETLSIIAYKQPVTKAQIERIRGVSSDHAVNKLVELELVRELGRLNAPGRPLLFGTTETFLRSFGVKSLSDLPDPGPDALERFKAEAEKEAYPDGKPEIIPLEEGDDLSEENDSPENDRDENPGEEDSTDPVTVGV